MLFDSMMAYCVEAMSSRMRGMAFSRRPGWVRTHQECSAPETRKREVSDSPERSFSSDIAQEWSAVAQPQASPWAEQTPCRCSVIRSEEHTSELQSPCNLVCRLLLEKK